LQGREKEEMGFSYNSRIPKAWGSILKLHVLWENCIKTYNFLLWIYCFEYSTIFIPHIFFFVPLVTTVFLQCDELYL
jgi:hypothetical protein